MNTNTENLKAAVAFWQKQAIAAESWPTYVVATSKYNGVLAANMAVIMAGADRPREFQLRESADFEADRLNDMMWDFDGIESFHVMGYRGFALKMVERFEEAVKLSQLADSLASRTVAA